MKRRKCEHCRAVFIAPKPTSKFCSRGCMTSHKSKKVRSCKCCGADTFNEKFCSHSCSASYNQTGRESNNKGKGKYKSTKDKRIAQDELRRIRRCEQNKRKKKPKRKSIKSLKPYKGYLVYGPRVENTGRWSVSLVHSETRRQFTKSLARYVMEVGLGRKLKKTQHVDHIDGNCMNDHWNNLQVLGANDNLIKGTANGTWTRKMFRFNCPRCNTYVEKRNSHNEGAGNLKRTLRFCSRECQTKFSVESKAWTNKALVRKAISRYKPVFYLDSTEHDFEGIGERIVKRTKGLRRVHNFVKRKGITIL